MNPADMQARGIEPGMLVAITSRRATIHAVVKDSKVLRPGVISMSHGYGIDLERVDAGADPGEPQPFSMGNHAGALASAEFDYEEPYTGIPGMSSIPVHARIEP
jgi:anaerobic selenocysteine-containing dehydrogenase